MTLHEKLAVIDEWLIFRRRLISDAKHMRLVDNGRYELMSPVSGEEGPTEIFNIRLESLPDEELQNTIQEIKDINLPHVQWPLSCSDRLHLAIRGEVPVHPMDSFALGVMTPGEIPCYTADAGEFVVRKVTTEDEFALWCEINRFDFGSFRPDASFTLWQKAN